MVSNVKTFLGVIGSSLIKELDIHRVQSVYNVYALYAP